MTVGSASFPCYDMVMVRDTDPRARDPVWSESEALLIRLVDALHDAAEIDDALWNALRKKNSRKSS